MNSFFESLVFNLPHHQEQGDVEGAKICREWASPFASIAWIMQKQLPAVWSIMSCHGTMRVISRLAVFLQFFLALASSFRFLVFLNNATIQKASELERHPMTHDDYISDHSK